MQYCHYYPSPIGRFVLVADEVGLTELRFDDQRDALDIHEEYEEKALPIFDDAKRWLDSYFSGIAPDFKLPVHLIGTPFQEEVWELLTFIPYGQSMTYGEIARILAQRKGMVRMSAQAVGGAVGRNKIPIIIPCHRVLGVNGALTGYRGGLNKKIALLAHEGIEAAKMRAPKTGKKECK